MPKRRDGASILSIALYILIILVFLKLFGILPGSPEYETISVALALINTILGVVVTFITWLQRRLGEIEDSISEISSKVSELERHLKVLEARLDIARLEKRISRLEEKLGG